jgi:hypothetical protein
MESSLGSSHFHNVIIISATKHKYGYLNLRTLRSSLLSLFRSSRTRKENPKNSLATNNEALHSRADMAGYSSCWLSCGHGQATERNAINAPRHASHILHGGTRQCQDVEPRLQTDGYSKEDSLRSFHSSSKQGNLTEAFSTSAPLTQDRMAMQSQWRVVTVMVVEKQLLLLRLLEACKQSYKQSKRCSH